MAIPEARVAVEVPQDVNVTLDPSGLVTVKGKNGELKRVFNHPDIRIIREGNEVLVQSDFPRKKTKALVGTWASHIDNMVRGSQKDFEYKLKIVFSHFPIKAKAQGDTFVIENFIGEKTPRKTRILSGAKVNVSGEEVIVTGADLERVAQTAANIEQATIIRGYDIRVFQDGIYIVVKGRGK